MRNSETGFTPAASHATNSSRDCNGVISIWSRAMQIPDVGRFDRTRRVAGDIPDRAVRRCERGIYYHRAATPSLTAGAGLSSHEQPSRSSRPHSLTASASDNLEPTCFSIAAEYAPHIFF